MLFISLHRTLDHILVVNRWILDVVVSGTQDRFDLAAPDSAY